METKPCKHCQTAINKKAKRCPHCAGDLRSWPARHPVVTVLLVVFFGFPVMAGVLDSLTNATKNTKSTSQSTSNQKAAPSATPAAPTPAPQKAYVEIYSTSGNGNKDTEAFTASGGKLKLVASVSGARVGSYSAIELKSEAGTYLSGNDLNISTPEGVPGGTAETIVRGESAGKYYVSVISGISWEVHVYEEK